MGFKTAEREDRVNVKLIDNQRIITRKKRIVGQCHSKIHPGMLTQTLMEQHECVGKNCHYFQKNECASYWEHLKQRQIVKDKRRKQKEEAKERVDAELAKSSRIQETLQQFIKDCGHNALIVQAKLIRPKTYTVFYVSGRSTADERRFPDFMRMVEKAYPGLKFAIKHIQDVDGHYVTIDEYKKRVV